VVAKVSQRFAEGWDEVIAKSGKKRGKVFLVPANGTVHRCGVEARHDGRRAAAVSCDAREGSRRRRAT